MKVILILMALVMVTSVHAEFGDGKLIEKSKEIREDRIELKKASNSAERKEAKMELRDDIKERRETFKTNLKMIKDEKKQKIVEKLDTRFNEVNTKRTTQMISHLDKMTKILDKLFDRGVVVTGASGEVEKARIAVVAQAARTYVISLSTEKNLKMDVGKVRSQLEADLKAVNELVIAARKAVQALIK